MTIKWGMRGAVVVNCNAEGNKFDAKYFCKLTLADIQRWVRKIVKYVGTSSYYIHMDNALCHKVVYTQEYMDSYQMVGMFHPPYSPDLVHVNSISLVT